MSSNLSLSYTPTEEAPEEGARKTQIHILPRRLKGLAASSGAIEGPCTILTGLENLHKIEDGAILVCQAASPKLAVVMHKLKALVTERGGPLAIASRYAREYEIPAVVGVNRIMQTVRDGDFIRVDGSNGTVEVMG
ncbi:MAG: Chondramide synthase cmdD [Syntrophorhabdus sp. PtaU1.Bin050]|nr:MAG: Chondramide synthase cmdD [Syntrophorhabdus sp. PtaU1.Bin050]